VVSFELKRPRAARGWLHYASKGLCFGFFGGMDGCGGSPLKSMILIFETPQAYSVNFDVTLSGDFL
jgi:hypothetical protein